MNHNELISWRTVMFSVLCIYEIHQILQNSNVYNGFRRFVFVMKNPFCSLGWIIKSLGLISLQKDVILWGIWVNHHLTMVWCWTSLINLLCIHLTSEWLSVVKFKTLLILYSLYWAFDLENFWHRRINDEKIKISNFY